MELLLIYIKLLLIYMKLLLNYKYETTALYSELPIACKYSELLLVSRGLLLILVGMYTEEE